jgi:hypothetical protein
MLRNKIYTTWLDSAQPVPDPNAGKEAQKKEKCSLEGVPMNESATLRDRVIMCVGAFFFLGGWPVSQDANSPQMTRAPGPTFETLDSTYPEFWVTRHTKNYLQMQKTHDAQFVSDIFANSVHLQIVVHP